MLRLCDEMPWGIEIPCFVKGFPELLTTPAMLAAAPRSLVQSCHPLKPQRFHTQVCTSDHKCKAVENWPVSSFHRVHHHNWYMENRHDSQRMSKEHAWIHAVITNLQLWQASNSPQPGFTASTPRPPRTPRTPWGPRHQKLLCSDLHNFQLSTRSRKVEALKLH